MAAPKGNKFWRVRSKSGRNPIFNDPQKLWDLCVEYFDWCHDNPLSKAVVYQGEVSDKTEPLMRAMTIKGLCFYLQIDHTTWRDYSTKDDFSQVCMEAEQIIYDQKFTGAAAGLLNASIIARDLGLKDANTSEISGPNGAPIKTESSIIFNPVGPND